MMRYPFFIVLWLFASFCNASDECAQRNQQAADSTVSESKKIQLYQRNIDQCTDEAKIAALNGLGTLYLTQGKYAQAEQFLTQSLDERKRLYGEHSEYVAYSLHELAKVYNDQALYAQAEPLLIQALEIKNALFGEDSLQSATSLNDLGLLYISKPEYAKAEPLLLKALAIRQQQLPENDPAIATIQNNLALLYTYLGDYEKAEPLYQTVLELRKQHYGTGKNYYRVANTMNAMALMYQYQQKLPQAEALYLQALAIWEDHYGANHPIIATIFNNLSTLYRSQGLEDKAKDFQAHALAIRQQSLGMKHPRVANSLNNLAVLYEREKQYDKAENMYLRALQIAIYNQQLELLWLVQDNLSGLLSRQGYTTAAIFWRKQAVNTLQSLRISISTMDESLRKSFVKSKSDVYAKLADLLMEQGRVLEAQQVLTMLKEEEYFDFVERDNAAADVRTTQALYNPAEQQWAQQYMEMNQTFLDIRQQLDGLEPPLTDAQQKQYQQLKQQLTQVDQQFESYLSRLRQDSGKVDTTDVGQENVQKLQLLQQKLGYLGQGAVLIHYLMTDEKLRIIVTSNDNQIAREAMIDKKTLNRKILTFLEVLQDPLKTPLIEAHELYQYIIKPIEADLAQANANILMLSLDTALHYVPIAALYDGKHYVIEKYALVTYNEASRTDLQQKPTQQWKIVGLGLSDAVLDFNPLPTVTTELDNIIQENSDDQGIIQGQLFLNKDFSEQTLQSVLTKEFPLMHIASHFVFTPGTQKDSYLLLGNGEKLTLDKVRQKYRFDNLDLLTLSACDTAVGDFANGREIEGFGTLAQNQGAKGVIATLWPVNDESTGQFMQQFYQLYVQEHINKAQAMQRVQQAFIQAGQFNQDNQSELPYYYAKPYYWAPFILMGNWL